VATIDLIQERALHQQHVLVDQLQTALDSRVLIEQAKGGLRAERHHIDPSNAFTLLRTYARSLNQRLTKVAAAVIDGRTAATELLASAPAATSGRDSYRVRNPMRKTDSSKPATAFMTRRPTSKDALVSRSSTEPACASAR
jgi:hypothetical protein